MTRRTKNINIVDEDVLLIHPNDAAHRDLIQEILADFILVEVKLL